MQINLTGFLNARNAREFVGELWGLLASAMENSSGIPTRFLDKKKEEIKKRQVHKISCEELSRDRYFSFCLSYMILDLCL